jgi:putative ABC transport system permease protein
MKRLFRFSSRTRREVDRDVRDEVAFHLDLRTRELIDAGLSREQARARAERQFGDVAATVAYCQSMDTRTEGRGRIRRLTEELHQDLAYGVRSLLKQPALTTIAALTIALGIGATCLVFAVVYAALLAPLPYRDADRLVVAHVSIPDYRDLQQSVSAFEATGLWASNLYTLDDEQLLGGVVTPNVFTTLGVSPVIGRTLDVADGAAPVVVLSEPVWRRRFGGDPRVVGRTIRLNGTGYTVIGVMPLRFAFPSDAFQLWTSMDFAATQAPGQDRNRALRIFQALGRLRPGVDIAAAQNEVDLWAARLERVHRDTNEGIRFRLTSLRDRQVGDVRLPLLVAFGAVGCLLLIACANIANLTLTRLTARTHELAIRAALGAGRGRIVRQLFTETALLVAFGGAAGVLLARWAVLALPVFIGDRVPRIAETTVSVPVLAVALAAIALTAVLVGSVPIHMGATALEPTLRAAGRGETSTPAAGRLRSILVVVQVAIAVTVLAGGLLLTHSLVRLLQVDTGVTAPERLLTFNLALLHQPTPAARATIAARVLDAIARVPGVRSAGGATGLTPINAQRGTGFEVEGHPDAPVNDRTAYFIAASPGYFRALGAHLVAGREFSASDNDNAAQVVVVSETLARRFFPQGGAVGRRLRLINPDYPADWRTIVGVVRDVRYQGLDDGPRPIVYTPFAQTPFLWTYVHVRTVGDPMAVVGMIRAAVTSIDPLLTVASPRPMTALIAEASADSRFTAVVITAFATLAIVLAATGLYGVVSFGVARRAREIAIQRALGASNAAVRWAVIRRAIALAAAGVVAGLLVAAWVSQFLKTLLFEISPVDPITLAAVALILFAVTVVASALPATRAVRIDPLQALREN